jgi:hypothetical protein
MAMVRTPRRNLPVTAHTTVADATQIEYESYAGGEVYIPTGSSLTLLTWHSSEKKDSTYIPAYDEDGVAVTQIVSAPGAYPIPTALFACAMLKIEGDAVGAVVLSLKS